MIATEGKSVWMKKCPKCGKYNICIKSKDNKNYYICRSCKQKYRTVTAKDWLFPLILVETNSGKRYYGVRDGLYFILDINGQQKRVKNTNFTIINLYKYQIKDRDGIPKSAFDTGNKSYLKMLAKDNYKIFCNGRDITKEVLEA